MLIIGIGNKARNGKDTAGEAIVNYYQTKRDIAEEHDLIPYAPKAKLFKFADALYKVCREEYGMKDKDAGLLQKVGDGRRNEFGLTYWIDQVAKSINTSKVDMAVITDVRYTNEANWIKRQGGYVINVTRVNPNGTPFITTDRDPNFISEIQLDNYNWDFYIRVKEGDMALTGEMAITISEYIRGITK